MIGRRNFLRVLGIGTVSAPIAAKAAVESEMASLTSLVGSAAPLASGVSYAGNPADEALNKNYVRMSQYLAAMGKLPEHVEHDVRERAKYVGYLDPDIACKRAWSLNVKILTQQQRNYVREIERYKRIGWYQIAQSKFSKLAGFTWQW